MRQNKTPRKVKVEYSTLYSERWERNFMVRSIGYGKPGAVFKEINDYYKSRPDLELIDSEQFVENIMLKHTADQPIMLDENTVGYINGITFKVICVHEYYLIRDEKMEDLLSYYGECMEARKQRRAKRDNQPYWDATWVGDLSPEQRKHYKTVMRKEVKK